jgi:hypothetical protein
VFLAITQSPPADDGLNINRTETLVFLFLVKNCTAINRLVKRYQKFEKSFK